MTCLTLRSNPLSADTAEIVAPRHGFPILPTLLAALVAANVASVVAMLLAA